MGLITGITVKLCQRTQSGVDAFNNPVYTESWVDIHNVVVGNPTAQEITDTVTLYGKYASYQLCIPKDDTHQWTDTKVQFFGKTWRTIGPAKQYMPHLLPLDWDKQVMVCGD